MPTHQKKFKKKIILLLLIIFFHLLPIFISAYYDIALHPSHQEVMKLSELRYWLWFFTWWSAWTSLLTIPWAVYKLLNLKKKKNVYSEQLADISIAEVNIISGIIFCCGGFILTFPSHPQRVILYPLLGKVKVIYVYIFYNLLWHILAPSLVFYYFWKYCQVDKLAQRRKTSLVVNLLNPTIYFFYVILRPLLSNFPKIDKSSSPHKYPRNYPYPFFFWSTGKVASTHEKEIKHSGGNKFFFWHYWPPWLQKLFWVLVVVILGYLTFSLLFYLLVKIKLKRDIKIRKKINIKAYVVK